MRNKNKGLRILFRTTFWFTYFFAGYLLYTNKVYIFKNSIYFLRSIYPLSVFWLQIRLNNRENWIPVDSNMSTSQLWFRILPTIYCTLTFLLVYLNFIISLTNYILTR